MQNVIKEIEQLSLLGYWIILLPQNVLWDSEQEINICLIWGRLDEWMNECLKEHQHTKVF